MCLVKVMAKESYLENSVEQFVVVQQPVSEKMSYRRHGSLAACVHLHTQLVHQLKYIHALSIICTTLRMPNYWLLCFSALCWGGCCVQPELGGE